MQSKSNVQIGDVVRLFPNAPETLVVDFNRTEVVLSWEDKHGIVREFNVSYACLQRAAWMQRPYVKAKNI